MRYEETPSSPADRGEREDLADPADAGPADAGPADGAAAGAPEPGRDPGDAGGRHRASPGGDQDASPAGDPPSILIRRGRTPTLGFWVTLCLLGPALLAILVSPFLAFPDLGSVLLFALVAALVVGLPLAFVATVVDGRRHRGPADRDR